MKNLRYIFALSLIIMSGNLLAETATITFASRTDDASNDANSAYTTSNFVNDGILTCDEAFGTITCTETVRCYKAKTDHGVKVGKSSSSTDGNFTISFSSLSNVTKIVLNRASYASDKTATITVKNGETTLADAVSTPSGTANFSDMEITDLNIASLSSLTVSSSKYCYIKSITITYVANCDNRITITKGAESHGTFTISPVGETCADDPVTVSVTNISPASGYVASVITTSASGTPSAIANGAGSVTGISASTTIGVTFVPKTSATLTKSVLGTTSDMGFSGYFIGDQVTLPGCDVVKQGYVFYGWSTTPFSESEYDSQKIYKAGDKFTLTQATQTLYAVYAVEEGTPIVTFDAFRQDNNMTSCSFVIASLYSNTYYAMKNNFTSSTSKIDAVAVTLTDGHLSETDAANYVLTFTKQGTSDTYKICNSNSVYLRGKASNETDLGGGESTDNGTTWSLVTGQAVVGSYRLQCNGMSRVVAYNGSDGFKNYSTSQFSYTDLEIIPVGSGYTYSGFATRFITYQNFAYKCTYDITYTLGDGHAWATDYEAPASYDHNLHGDDITLPVAANLADGQYFRGWYNNENLEGDPITSLAVTGNGDKSLYADWASVVNFYVQDALAETQTIDNEGKVTGYTPTATCTGKQFMGWTATDIDGLVQEAPEDLFTDFSGKEFTASTNLYAVYASVNGGKIIGEATHNDNVSSYVFDNKVKECPMQYATYTLDENTKFQNSQINSKDYIGFRLDASQADAHVTTTKIKDLKSISFDYITSGYAINYYVKISTDGETWTKITEEDFTLLSNKDNTHTISAINVTPQGDYYVQVGVIYKQTSSYAVITKMSYTTATRSYWYSDYSTTCDMAASATIRYIEGGTTMFETSATTVGEQKLISDGDAKKGYELHSLTIHGVIYNVGEKYILAHDVTPEAADIRPIMTWKERYADTWSQTTTPADGKLVLPATQPASFAPGLYEFDGWTTEIFTTDTKTAQPTYVTAETDAPATPTTYYAVYKKANASGTGYIYRQTTPSPLYQLTYSPNGGDGTDYITYTDLTTATTPASSLFTREGATLVGWTLNPNAETIEYVGTSTQITNIDGDRHYYAVWIGKLEMSSDIALTSASGATVGSATFTLSSKNLGTITALRFSYKDVDNDIEYRPENRSKSEFRLCNDSYTLAEDNLDVSTISTNFSHTYTITYAPNSGNKMSHYQLVVEMLNNSKVMTTQEFDLLGRALPDQFVIATQKEGKWYALQANMTKSDTWAGVEINVEGTGTEMVAFASDTLLYSLRTYNNDKSHVLFQSAYKQGHLWAASGTETGIRNYATTITGENNPYAWLLASENDLLSYTIRNKQEKTNHQYLGMNGTDFGMYQLTTPMQFSFLPLGFMGTIEITNPDGNLSEYEGQNLSHADIVVKPNATLTINQSVTVKDVTIETGGKLNITGETFTINSLHLEGGWNEEHTLYDVPNVYIAPEASLEKAIDFVNLDMRVDKANYYPFAVPFPVKVSDVDYVDATLATASTYGTHYVIKTYDGARRAANRMDKENNWVAVPADATLQPGVGYILTAVTVDGYDKRLRFPMTFSNDWTTNGEQGEVAEMVKNQTHIYQFESGIHSCHSGWNMVAVPFMSAYGDGENTVLDGVTYVTIPTYNFDEYKQVEVKDTVLRPEWSFFIQAENDGTLNFLTEQERLMTSSPLSAPQRVEDMPEYAVAMRLSSSTTSDKTTLKVSDRYSTAYEIGADLEKMFGSGYTLATYTVIDGTRLAFNAMSKAEAQQIIPVGYRAPEAGDYTFSVQDAEDVSGFAHLYLTDNQTGITTDLLTAGYTFNSARTQDDERFVLNVQMRTSATPTALDEAMTNGQTAPQKVIYRDKFYIINKGVVYDGQGKRVMMK